MTTDHGLQQRVQEELDWEPSLNASLIFVAIHKGVVTLTGEVTNYAKKLAAEKAVKRVAGVKAVVDQLEVGLSISDLRTDGSIAQAALDTIRWHCELDEKMINVKVDHGTVYLEGQVDWAYQRDTAEKAVMNISGVKKINNYLTVRPRLTIADLKDRIDGALSRSATIDASRITVELQDHKAVLNGTVRSFAEKEDAEKAVWAAPGIARVDNHLEIAADSYAIVEVDR